MSLKAVWVVDHRRMIVTLRTDRLSTLQDVREFLDGSRQIDLHVSTRTDAYAFIERTLTRFDYVHLGKAEKGLLRELLGKVTGFSRAQLARLLTQHRTTGLSPATLAPVSLAHPLRTPRRCVALSCQRAGGEPLSLVARRLRLTCSQIRAAWSLLDALAVKTRRCRPGGVRAR